MSDSKKKKNGIVEFKNPVTIYFKIKVSLQFANHLNYKITSTIKVIKFNFNAFFNIDLFYLNHTMRFINKYICKINIKYF